MSAPVSHFLSSFHLSFPPPSILPFYLSYTNSKMSSNHMFAADNKQLKIKEVVEFIQKVVKKDPKYVKQPVTYPGIHGARLEAQYLELHSKAGLIVTSDKPAFPITDGDENPKTLQTESVLTVGQLLTFLKDVDDDAPVSSLVWLNENTEPSRILNDHVMWGLCISPY